MNRPLIAIGAAFAFLGVLLGAFGAHALRTILDAEHKAIYETGVHYQLLHSVGLMFLGLLAADEDKRLVLAGRLMAAGIVFFSFSLYALAVTQIKIFGAVTPIGGVCFLISWALLFSWALAEPVTAPSP